MKEAYLENLAKQLEDVSVMHGAAFDAALKKLSGGKLEAGARCAWCYDDDLQFWGNTRRYPKDWFYHGLIIPTPDYELRGGEIEHDHCVVVITDYPVEKCYVECDWTPLLQILEVPELRRFHVMHKIRPL